MCMQMTASGLYDGIRLRHNHHCDRILRYLRHLLILGYYYILLEDDEFSLDIHEVFTLLCYCNSFSIVR